MVIEQGAFLNYLGRDKSPVQSWTHRHQRLLTDVPIGLFNDEQMERVEKDDAVIRHGVVIGLEPLGFGNSQIERGFAEPRRFFKDRSVYYRVTFTGDGAGQASPITFVYYPGGKEDRQYLRCDQYTVLYVPRRAGPNLTVKKAMEYIQDPGAIHRSIVFVENFGSFDAERVADFVQVLAIGKTIENTSNSPRS